MVVWLLYLTGVGSVLGLAALLAERGLRHLGRPVRWAWVVAMILTLGVPVAVALAFAGGATVGTSSVDRVLIVVWSATSLAMLANLRLSGWTLRRNERSWRTGRVDGHRVLVTAGFGPGVIGATRPRVVLPGWILESAPSLRRLVVAHEVEHVRAGDPRLLLGGLIVVALLPWCLPLWWQLHRLRGAIETDCDARVLAATAAPREYAHTLVAVAGRRTQDFLPMPALAPGAAELRRRIRFITAGPRERSGLVGAGFLAIAALVVLGLAAVPVPKTASPGSDAAPVAEDLPRDAIIIFSVGVGGSPGQPRAR